MWVRPAKQVAGMGIAAAALVVVTSGPFYFHFAGAAAPNKPEPGEPGELRGRVLCLAEEMRDLYQVELPTGHAHLYGFKTEDGKYFTLLRNKYSEALFIDKRLQEKELILKGRTFPKTQLLEVSVMRSVRNGVTNDLYYYCVVCSIKAVGPGKCECCQDPVELVERPLESAKID